MICVKCGIDRGNEFYSRDRTCKECRKRRVRENRAEKIDYYREYDKNRFQNDPKVLARHKRYQKTPKGKAAMDAARKKFLVNNPEKRAAHIRLGNAIRDGAILKPPKCSSCGVTGVRIHGHHDDYSKPLDVIWVCSKCHWKIHNP